MTRPVPAILTAAFTVALVVAMAPGVAQEVVTIDMRDFSFQPHEQIVRAGAAVRWVNRDDFPHAIAMQGGKPGSSPGLIDSGKEYTFVFREAGRFVYRCGVHPTMLGEIIVEEF